MYLVVYISVVEPFQYLKVLPLEHQLPLNDILQMLFEQMLVSGIIYLLGLFLDQRHRSLAFQV